MRFILVTVKAPEGRLTVCTYLTITALIDQTGSGSGGDEARFCVGPMTFVGAETCAKHVPRGKWCK